jgi:hypothetical protein
MPGIKCWSVGIHPVTVWHGYSTNGALIIVMITLTMDKYALVKDGFSI